MELLAGGKPRLQVLPLGDVARDLDEPAMVPMIAVHGVDSAKNEEARAVLTKVPALIFGCAVRESFRSLSLGNSRGAVLGRVKQIHGLSQHLIAAVAEKALRPRIPTADGALCIRREN